jgi:hypothetical protein
VFNFGKPKTVGNWIVHVAGFGGECGRSVLHSARFYEAVSAALTSLRKDEWVGKIGTGLTTVKG